MNNYEIDPELTLIEAEEDEYSWPDSCDENLYNDEDKSVEDLVEEILSNV
jgi:hypothetical protein